MKTLVIYFTRTGHTQTLARQIAADCAADIEGLQERDKHTGVVAYASAVVQALLHTPVAIAPCRYAPSAYGLVVIGTPIWAWQMAGPVRSYILQYRAQFSRVAVFCTSGGSGQTKVLADMQALCAQPAVATFGASVHQMQDRLHHQRLASFVAKVRATDPAIAAVPLAPRPPHPVL